MRKLLETLPILLLCLLLAACGEQTAEKAAEESEKQHIDYEALFLAESTVDTTETVWKCGAVQTPEYYMSPAGYYANLFPDHHLKHKNQPHYATDGDKLYKFTNQGIEQNDCTVYLDILDTTEMTVSSRKFDDLSFWPRSYCVSNGEIWAYGFVDPKEKEEGSVIAAKLDAAGTVEFVAFEGQTVWEDRDCYYEADSGYHYFLTAGGSILQIFDSQGVPIKEIEGNSEHRETFSALCQTSNGKWLFQREDSVSKQQEVFCIKGGDATVLCEDLGFYGTDFFTDCHGRILYKAADGSIVCWNPLSGERQNLFSGTEDLYQYAIALLRNKKGEVIVVNDVGEARVCSFGGPVKEVTITIQPYPAADYYLKASIEKYEKTHPGVHFEISDMEFSVDARDREFGKIFAEMTTGKGPDILELDREYLLSFYEQNCLADLSDMLAEGTREKLYKGVLEYGSVGGKFLMLPLELSAGAALVKNSVWNKDTWTINDMLAVIEEHEKNGAEFDYLGISPRGIPYNPIQLFINDIAHSEFVDWEKRKSSFDSEKFRQILEICKKYNDKRQEDAYFSEAEVRRMLKSEKLLLQTGEITFESFSNDMAAYGEEYHYVGNPTNSGNGNFLFGNRGLCVNKNAENQEVIFDFLNALYTFDYTNFNGLFIRDIRSDLYEGRIADAGEYDWTDSAQIRINGHQFTPIGSKQDGTSFLPEYVTFRNSMSLLDEKNGFLQDIILEEAEPFFEGHKDAATVAEIIQNRIQIYLEE